MSISLGPNDFEDRVRPLISDFVKWDTHLVDFRHVVNSIAFQVAAKHLREDNRIVVIEDHTAQRVCPTIEKLLVHQPFPTVWIADVVDAAHVDRG